MPLFDVSTWFDDCHTRATRGPQPSAPRQPLHRPSFFVAADISLVPPGVFPAYQGGSNAALYHRMLRPVIAPVGGYFNPTGTPADRAEFVTLATFTYPPRRPGRGKGGESYVNLTGYAADRVDMTWESRASQPVRMVSARAGAVSASFVNLAGTPADRVDISWESRAFRPLPRLPRLAQSVTAAPASLVDTHVLTFGWESASTRGRAAPRPTPYLHSAEVGIAWPVEAESAALYGQSVRPTRPVQARLQPVLSFDPAPISAAAVEVSWFATHTRPTRGPGRGAVFHAMPSFMATVISPAALSGPWHCVAMQVSWAGAVAADIVED